MEEKGRFGVCVPIMHNGLILLISSFILFSCGKSEKYKRNLDPVVTGLNENIYMNDFDSILSEEIYILRKQVAYDRIYKELCIKEAEKNNMTYDELQISLWYSNGNNSDNKDSIIRARAHRKKEYTDSLCKVYRITLSIVPDYFKNISLENKLSTCYVGNHMSKDTITIISSLNCPTCLHIKLQIEDIIEKYNDKVLFQYILTSDYLDNQILACFAAANQNAFYEMFSKLSEINRQEFGCSLNDTALINIAKELDLDILKFKSDLKSNNLLKKTMLNKSLLTEKGIYSVPTFIVNSKLLDAPNSIDYLDLVIEGEIR